MGPQASVQKAGREAMLVCYGDGARESGCAATIIFAGRDNYFCRLAPRLIKLVRLRFIV